MLAAFGPAVLPQPISYADWFGLWLNLERVWLQQSVAVARGVAWAMGKDEIPKQAFEAIAATEAEASYMDWHENIFRAAARGLRHMEQQRGYAS